MFGCPLKKSGALVSGTQAKSHGSPSPSLLTLLWTDNYNSKKPGCEELSLNMFYNRQRAMDAGKLLPSFSKNNLLFY
jgi:hypothetical protein